MTLDMIVNILFVLFVGNIFGILAASNLGYVLAHLFTLSAFVLLRKDRPTLAATDQARGRHWWRSPALLRVLHRLTIVGFGWFQNAAGGYGGTKEKIIGVSVLGRVAPAVPLSGGSCRTASARTGARTRPRFPARRASDRRPPWPPFPRAS